jgi:NADH-quinone oxidoreductase subunit M
MELAQVSRDGSLQASLAENINWGGMNAERIGFIVFLGVLAGFAVKVPLMPFHTWLPSTYSEAPSGTTLLLTGVLSKMGVYGMLRILLPIFPDQLQSILTPLLWLAVVTIVFSACAAFAQKDLKRIFAYSSINHLGYCMLAVFAVVATTDGADRWNVERASALSGAMLQMFNHGLTAAALFAFVAFIEKRAGGNRGLNDFGGLRKVMPVFCGLMGISMFASLGLPGLNGFVGEFLIFKGVFSLAPWTAAISTIGLLVTAVFLLTILQRVFSGPLNENWKSMCDLSLRERWITGPAVALMFLIGIWPQIIIEVINPTVIDLVEGLKQ